LVAAFLTTVVYPETSVSETVRLLVRKAVLGHIREVKRSLVLSPWPKDARLSAMRIVPAGRSMAMIGVHARMEVFATVPFTHCFPSLDCRIVSMYVRFC
jgi:hypothetical protein